MVLTPQLHAQIRRMGSGCWFGALAAAAERDDEVVARQPCQGNNELNLSNSMNASASAMAC